MRYRGIRALAAIAAAAGVASATTFVEQDFEGGGFPPAGWLLMGSGVGNGGWTLGTGGPFGYYALGWSRSPVAEGYNAQLWSPAFAVTAGTRVYYRFEYAQFYSGSGAGFGAFVFRTAAGVFIGGYPVDPSGWRTYSGSRVITTAGSIRGSWESIAAQTGSNTTNFYVDNILLADAPFSAVAPASLGRVKTLFQ
jgi:hypothetical protein